MRNWVDDREFRCAEQSFGARRLGSTKLPGLRNDFHLPDQRQRVDQGPSGNDGASCESAGYSVGPRAWHLGEFWSLTNRGGRPRCRPADGRPRPFRLEFPRLRAWRNGRRDGFRCHCSKERVGSSPSARTELVVWNALFNALNRCLRAAPGHALDPVWTHSYSAPCPAGCRPCPDRCRISRRRSSRSSADSRGRASD